MKFAVYILLIFLLSISFVIERKKVTPSKLFNLTFLITIFLYNFKLSYLQRELSNKTYTLLFLSIALYNIGIIVISFLYKRCSKSFEIPPEEVIENRMHIARNILIILFVIEIAYSGGAPLLWNLIGIKKTYFEFGIPSLNGALYGLIILLGVYNTSKKRKESYIYFLISIIILSRQLIISIVIESVILYLLQNKVKISLKKIVIAVVLLLISFNIMGNFRSGQNAIEKVFRPRPQYATIPKTIKWIYSYMEFSLTNLDNLVLITNGGVNHGVSVLKEFLPTVIMTKFDIKENYSPYYLELINFNVSTYMPSLYLDFGIIGIAVFNFFIGIFGGSLYYSVQRDNNMKNILKYCIFIHNILLLFFTNMFLYLPIMVQYIYVYILYRKEKV